MNLKLIIDKLGFKNFSNTTTSPKEDLLIIQKSLSVVFPKELNELLLEFKGAIGFERGLKFRMDGECNLADSKGLIGISLLYGINDDDFGILSVNKMYGDQIPDSVVIIGDSNGGNQICIEKSTGRILFWNHEGVPNVDELFNIAPSFGEFLQKLEIDEDDEVNIDDVDDYDFGF